MSVTTFINHVAASHATKPKTLYHFTDARNISSIRAHGLLSTAALRNGAIEITAPGGSQGSRIADRKLGLDQYVHLCLLNDNAMEYICRQEGRITETVWLEIDLAVLHTPGVMACDRVSIQSEAVVEPLEEFLDHADWQIMYDYANWKDDAVQDRRTKAKKFEVLIPNRIPIDMIRNIPNG